MRPQQKNDATPRFPGRVRKRAGSSAMRCMPLPASWRSVRANVRLSEYFERSRARGWYLSVAVAHDMCVLCCVGEICKNINIDYRF